MIWRGFWLAPFGDFMAKDNRQILSAVRFGGKLYKDGMEDELQTDLSREEIQRLLDRGAIAGDFKGTGKPKAETDEKPKK